MGRGYFLGRQPIVDGSGRTVGYELLYRAGAASVSAEFGSEEEASLQVIANTFAGFGVAGVLGPHLGLLNVTREMLLADLIFALPPERVVFEILESVEFDAALEERCKELSERGYRLALDDYVPDDPREPYLDLVDLVKIDLPAIPKSELAGLVHELSAARLTVLAEKVETAREFQRCRALGCELFQGFYFARPTTLSGNDDVERRTALLRILAEIQSDAEPEVLAEGLEAQPMLGLRLLLAGVEQDPQKPGFLSALHAARLLEQLAQRLGVCETRGSAFLAGILHATAERTRQPVAELVSGLDLDPGILAGLLRGDGPMGELLRLTADLPRGGRDDLEALLRGFGLSPEALLHEEARAYEWVHQVSEEVSGS